MSTSLEVKWLTSHGNYTAISTGFERAYLADDTVSKRLALTGKEHLAQIRKPLLTADFKSTRPFCNFTDKNSTQLCNKDAKTSYYTKLVKKTEKIM